MRHFIAVTVAIACLAITAEAWFFPTIATTAAGATTTTIAVGGASSIAAVAGGAILLKALALGGLYVASRAASSGGSSRRRGRRSADGIELEDDDLAFTYISQSEPEQCYRRLICELATGHLAKSENEVILSLFDRETPATSPKYDYAIAATIGKQLKNVQTCEIRYSCQLTGAQMEKLFN